MKYRQKTKLETRVKSRFRKPSNNYLFKVGKSPDRKFNGFYSGSFNNIRYDSGWELVFIVFCLDKNIPITRCDECFDYRYAGSIRRFYPDFKIGNTYIEVKGIINDQVLAKISYFPKNLELIILGKNEINRIFNYVYKKYGENFINLYTK